MSNSHCYGKPSFNPKITISTKLGTFVAELKSELCLRDELHVGSLREQLTDLVLRKVLLAVHQQPLGELEEVRVLALVVASVVADLLEVKSKKTERQSKKNGPGSLGLLNVGAVTEAVVRLLYWKHTERCRKTELVQIMSRAKDFLAKCPLVLAQGSCVCISTSYKCKFVL